MFKAGYKFKPNHSEIHFIKNNHKRAGSLYSTNFTTEANLAKLFTTKGEAEECINRLMNSFKKDDDYRWTPIILNIESGESRIIINSKWY